MRIASNLNTVQMNLPKIVYIFTDYTKTKSGQKETFFRWVAVKQGKACDFVLEKSTRNAMNDEIWVEINPEYEDVLKLMLESMLQRTST